MSLFCESINNKNRIFISNPCTKFHASRILFGLYFYHEIINKTKDCDISKGSINLMKITELEKK